MNRNPYNSYRGRGGLGRKILVVIVILLVIALALALAGLFVLPNYVIYTADGPQLVLPWFSGQSQPTREPAPSAVTGAPAEDDFVVDTPSPSPSPSPSPTAPADLSDFPRRDVPRGLVVAAGEGPGEGQGFIFDMRVPATHPDRDGSAQFNRSLLYAAAYVNPAWDSILAGDDTARSAGFADYMTAWCLDAAARGYDEIILSDGVTAENDPKGAAQAALYRRLKEELTDAGWQGRLGLVLDQSLAGSDYDADLIPAVAQSFDRLYFRHTLQGGMKSALTANGFAGTSADIVTIYADVPSGVSWSWAVLP